MILREITVGRSKDCDIYLDPRCRYASNYHGTIYYDGNQLMFKDGSTNGTMINNVSVKHRAVPIYRGDTIMLAGRYQINWNQIDSFFPPLPVQNRGTVLDESMHSQTISPVVNTSKWNWGAFGLYPIWGFFNGCWWAFLVSFFFWWTYPIPNIIFGVYGTKWAWTNRTWINAQDFLQTQSNWATWGIIITCLNVLFYLWLIGFYMALFI